MTKGSPEGVGVDAARLERIGPAMQAYVDCGTYAGVSTIVARAAWSYTRANTGSVTGKRACR
jgi:hypothetical protein